MLDVGMISVRIACLGKREKGRRASMDRRIPRPMKDLLGKGPRRFGEAWI
jgi:hypothetical protein